MNGRYILDGHKAVPEPDLIKWAQWFENQKQRRVAFTKLPNGNKVSTVFLGLDHQFGNGKPLLFETMVFPKDSLKDQDCERYSTWEEAEAGHAEMVRKWSQVLQP